MPGERVHASTKFRLSHCGSGSAAVRTNHLCQVGSRAPMPRDCPQRPWESPVSFQWRTHEATAVSPSLNSVHFPQPPRSCPEEDGTPKGAPDSSCRAQEPKIPRTTVRTQQQQREGPYGALPTEARAAHTTSPAQLRGKELESWPRPEGLGRPRGVYSWCLEPFFSIHLDDWLHLPSHLLPSTFSLEENRSSEAQEAGILRP